MAKSQKSDAKTMQCAMCHCPLGKEFGELPFFIPDGQGGKQETFCAQDFAWKRAPMEPERFPSTVFVAIKCARCGLCQVDVGLGKCNQCGNRTVLALPPKRDPIVA